MSIYKDGMGMMSGVSKSSAIQDGVVVAPVVAPSTPAHVPVMPENANSPIGEFVLGCRIAKRKNI